MSEKAKPNMIDFKFKLPRWHDKKLREIGISRKISLTRLICFALDNELIKDRPFEFDLELSKEDNIEYAYADQAGKILTFINSLHKGVALDILVLLRHSIGIESKAELLGGFKELVDADMIESFIPPVRKMYTTSYNPNYKYWRKKDSPEVAKKQSRQNKKYAKYLKLKAEFEKEGEA